MKNYINHNIVSSESSYTRNVILVLLGVLFFAFFIIRTFDFGKEKEEFNFPPTGRIEPAEIHAVVGVTQQLKLWFDEDGPSGPAAEKDVTDVAVWSVENPDMAFVSSAAPLTGEFMAREPGVTKVRVLYDETIDFSAPVTVTPAVMEVRCYSKPTRARVGEDVSWVAGFTKLGVPYYTYEWSGADGLTGDTPILLKTYTTRGTKTAHVYVKDSVDTKGEAECSLVVE